MSEHLAGRALTRTLGVAPPTAQALARLARSRATPAGHWARLAALVVATSRAGRLLPRRARVRAIETALGRLFRGPGDLMLFAGMIGDLAQLPCGGLRPE